MLQCCSPLMPSGSLPPHLLYVCQWRQTLGCNRRRWLSKKHGDNMGLLWVAPHLTYTEVFSIALSFDCWCNRCLWSISVFLCAQCLIATLLEAFVPSLSQVMQSFWWRWGVKMFKWVWKHQINNRIQTANCNMQYFRENKSAVSPGLYVSVVMICPKTDLSLPHHKLILIPHIRIFLCLI